MDGNFIELRAALREMRQVDPHGNPVPFSIEWCTADVSRKTGGDIRKLAKAYMSGAEIGRVEKLDRAAKLSKLPNHYGNATRNIKDVSGDLKKVHIHLILSINGKTVL